MQLQFPKFFLPRSTYSCNHCFKCSSIRANHVTKTNFSSHLKLALPLLSSIFSFTEQLWPRHILHTSTSCDESKLTSPGTSEQQRLKTFCAHNRVTTNSFTTETTRIHLPYITSLNCTIPGCLAFQIFTFISFHSNTLFNFFHFHFSTFHFISRFSNTEQ